MYVCECERVRETTTAKSRSVRWPARTHRRGDRGKEGGRGEEGGRMHAAVRMSRSLAVCSCWRNASWALTSAYISYWAL